MIFYFALFLFIISIVIGLVLMIAGKGMRRDRFLLLTSIHAIFLFAFIASLLLQKENNSANNYFFTAFICSGIILGGVAWRSDSPFLLRIYFSIFELTIPMFIFSPSMFLNFLITTNYSSTNGSTFHLTENYYLETQNVSRQQDSIPHYKLIVKKGMFHQSIQRDLSFGGILDSVRVIEIEPGKNILVRGFTSINTYVSADIDSVDLRIPLVIKRQGDVEYHL